MSSEERESRNPGRPDSEAEPEAESAAAGYERSGEDFAQADPDVLLDVPKLQVDELNLEVEELKSRVALRTRLAELLEVDVGLDISLGEVKLEVKGVEAEARLKARLDTVQAMIERTLASVDDNPELIKDLVDLAGKSASKDGGQPAIRGDAPAREATEAARKKAEELELDLSSLEGTGSGGRITLNDVRRAARG